MKRLAGYIFVLITGGCTNPDSTVKTRGKEHPVISTNQHFFPVTDYLKGQITEIKKSGVNPLKITTVNNHTDSAWVKMEDLDLALATYLEPVIDTGNLKEFFKETKFLDQTLNAYTFTYERIKDLPDSLNIQHWDVYIDPSRNTVSRIYLVKKQGDKTIQQTWQNNHWCKTVIISKDGKVEKEELIKWKF